MQTVFHAAPLNSFTTVQDAITSGRIVTYATDIVHTPRFQVLFPMLLMPPGRTSATEVAQRFREFILTPELQKRNLQSRFFAGIKLEANSLKGLLCYLEYNMARVDLLDGLLANITSLATSSQDLEHLTNSIEQERNHRRALMQILQLLVLK